MRPGRTSLLATVATASLLASSCGSTPPAATSPPRPACTIAGLGEPGFTPTFPIFDEPIEQGEPLAIVDGSRAHVVWSEFPPLGAPRVARAALTSQGLRLHGWAPLEGRTFRLLSPIGIRDGSMWANRGAEVEILGLEGERVRVRVRTGFTAPDAVEATTTCHNLAYAAELPSGPGGPLPPEAERAAVPTGARLDLLDEPDGDPVVSLDPSGGCHGEIAWLEQRGDFVRIAHGGSVAGVAGHPFVFVGWVRADQVERSPEGEGRSCARSASPARRPEGRVVRVLRDADLVVGPVPAGTHVAVAQAGAILEALDEHGGCYAVFPWGRHVEAPQGKRFWIRVADVERVR